MIWSVFNVQVFLEIPELETHHEMTGGRGIHGRYKMASFRILENEKLLNPQYLNF